MQTAKNIQDAFGLTLKGWAELEGKKVHLGVGVGQITEEAVFRGLISREQLLVLDENVRDDDPLVLNALHEANKVRVQIGNRIEDLYWGDIIELWPLEKNCDSCGGKGKLSDKFTKSAFPALNWLSFDEESCTSCGGIGKVRIV